MANITYLLGAGASYNACPIWKEQAEKMIELSRKYLPNDNFEIDRNPYELRQNEFIFWEIGYFGQKAQKFNTIDTYAKKLLFNASTEELDRLKFAISIFFTIWRLDSNLEIKNKGRYPDLIDRRYINLLAALLEGDSNSNPILPKNINIVTWNYDLQFEFAYKSFCRDEKTWRDIEQTLHFTNKYKETLQVCHLNGYHGYYIGGRGEVNILDRSNNSNFEDILESILFTSNSVFEQKIKFYEHINYAWETESDIATATRKRAKQIFVETDILIIIGYSFPPFTKEVDRELFRSLKNKNLKIIYQDPNAELLFFKSLKDVSTIEIELLPHRMENFFYPY